jgi:hypothetical protein
MTLSKKVLNLKIIFDTNIIFNGSSSSDLLTNEIIELIDKYSNPVDIKISWHTPEIVLDERRFQMRKRGLELLPSLNKIEKLLGHNLGITKDILEARIDEAISKSVTKYKLEIEKILHDKIDWKEIIRCSSFRLPPFEDSNKEKGFRDALILETVMQIIETSPKSASICKIFFITNDKLLSEAFNSKIKEKTNVRLLSSIEELESLINILDSQIKEELINAISEKAEKLFFLKKDENTLYYKEKIWENIVEKYPKEIFELPPNADKRENSQIWISKPGFVKKEKQKFFWKTPITIDIKAISTKYAYNPVLPSSALGGLVGGISNIFQPSSASLYGINRSPEEAIQTSQEVISTGKSKFEIIWSVTLTQTKILKTPKIESINFIETIWI